MATRLLPHTVVYFISCCCLTWDLLTVATLQTGLPGTAGVRHLFSLVRLCSVYQRQRFPTRSQFPSAGDFALRMAFPFSAMPASPDRWHFAERAGWGVLCVVSVAYAVRADNYFLPCYFSYTDFPSFHFALYAAEGRDGRRWRTLYLP